MENTASLENEVCMVASSGENNTDEQILIQIYWENGN